MVKGRIITGILTVWFATALIMSKAAAEDRIIAGWAEDVWITTSTGSVRLPAKLDTGAATSSVSSEFVRAAHPGSITFVFPAKPPRLVIAPVVRVARIRRAGAQVDERPVVSLEVCVAGVRRLTEFTVAERSQMRYPLLIGRRFLQHGIVVNSALTHIAPASCEAMKAAQ